MSLFLSEQISSEANISSINRLDELGLEEDLFINAISQGMYEGFKSTDLHPKTDSGVRAWGEIIASLRAELLTRDPSWNKKRENGLELIFNKNLGISIIVTTGDFETGLNDGCPLTKNVKGNATNSIVNKNLELFSSNDIDLNSIDSMTTWILLYFFDYAKKEVRSEFSLPVGMVGKKDNLKIGSWKERIILSPVSFESANIKIDTDFTDDIVFKLKTK